VSVLVVHVSFFLLFSFVLFVALLLLVYPPTPLVQPAHGTPHPPWL
jgi:hypothetical protein